MTDVTVVVVTYNSSRFIPACLGALPGALGGCSYEVVVVDNDSKDDTLERVAESLASVRIVRNDDNAGFARASNQGIELALGRYVLLLNPDAVAWPGSVEALFGYMESHPRCGIAGPQLRDSSGGLQYSLRNFPTPGNQLFESLFLHRVAPALSARFGEVVYDRDVYQTSRVVRGWVSGAAMMMRPEALSDVGLLDESYFMYSEEKDLCYRMALAGWTVDYVSTAIVTHGHDQPESPQAFARQLTSKLLYFDKHYSGLRQLGCEVGLWVGFGIRVLLGAVATVLGSERRHNLLVPWRGIPVYLESRRSDARGGRGSL